MNVNKPHLNNKSQLCYETSIEIGNRGGAKPIAVENFQMNVKLARENLEKVNWYFLAIPKHIVLMYEVAFNEKNKRKLNKFINRNQLLRGDELSSVLIECEKIKTDKQKQPFYRQQEQFRRW